MKLLGKLAVVMTVFLAPITAKADEITIDFQDGLTTPTQPGGAAVSGFYAGLGMTSPNLRFHDGTYSGNVPFNFVDGWGAVLDSGSDFDVAILNFASPVDFVLIDALAQSDFNLSGNEPFFWSITAFDANGDQVAFASEMFGFDFAGTSNSPGTDPFPLAVLSLIVEATGSISSIEIYSERKTGFDTISFGSQSILVTVPEPGTLGLLGIGLFGMAFMRRRAIARHH